MRLSRFFIDCELQSDQSLLLPPSLVNYIINVLRLKQGDSIHLFNGHPYKGIYGEFPAQLLETGKRKALVQLGQFIARDIESPLKVHLLQGISRSERMDFTIQKSVELGCSQITPVFTERSNSRKLKAKQLEKKQQHWQSVADSACEQSGRTRRVQILPAIKPYEAEKFSADLQLLLVPNADQSLTDLHRQAQQNMQDIKSVNIFIGPEGGLSPGEIEYACSQGYQGVHLGPRILRTETAGLTALSVVQLLWGDLS